MEEIGIESTVLKQIFEGNKTVEGRLGKAKFLKLKVGDSLQLREDVWENGSIIKSIPNQGIIRITQILYFVSFREMLESLDIESILPTVKSLDEAIATYHTFYTPEDEAEYGVVAFTFKYS
ncbi:MAG TPA: ASCH domain-containing protein [Candidatus Saccharimonadales bacterium]|jgi:ASC-1-like (ASCH) protein